ncbi:MAG: hypothetical protein C6I00_03170 [Nitratiruptor sp.]|nr:hypothetical protein [Nitratiruptor sp.]NPA83460.1 DUF87 domain-containing protein [Campylobacterota bacterium]
MSSPLYEALDLFYLGEQLDDQQQPTGLLELLRHDALTTHAVIVGMTGSGKTGLGIVLLEEAAIDGIPAIIVDPKGDMGNLLLAFEELDPKSFQPWVDPLKAKQAGLSLEEYSAKIAATWRQGLAKSHQDPQRIGRYKRGVERTIYTPGSSAGLPINLLGSFQAPPPSTDPDSYAQLLGATATGLLRLVEEEGREATIFLANLLDHFWSQGVDLDLAQIVAAVIEPPFERVGILPLEHFFPTRERTRLALALNTLLSDPTRSFWFEGEPLQIDRLLYTSDGRPRHAIFTISHLQPQEQIFFLTRLLSQLITWMGRQSGSSTLRALLYIDEIFGFFPPTANPPSKGPMLRLLKQARAYGLGIVLSTQNPADLDYKGLGNIGTWFLGRLQTRQDVDRLIDGLVGRGQESREIRSLLASLQKRTFLLRSIHREHLELFRTRWALSYLKGPLTQEEIRRLMASKTPKPKPAPKPLPHQEGGPKPPLSPKIPEGYEILDPTRPPLFAPFLYLQGRLLYYAPSKGVDKEVEKCTLIPLSPAYDPSNQIPAPCRSFPSQPPEGARYLPIDPKIQGLESLAPLEREYRDWLYRNERLILYRVKRLRMTSAQDEPYEAFLQRVHQVLREKRHEAIQKLQERYASRFARLKERMERVKERLEKEEGELSSQVGELLLSIGSALFDGLFASKSKRSKVGRAAKRSYKEYRDLQKAKEHLAHLQEEFQRLEEELEGKIQQIKERFDPANYPIEELPIRPRKRDIVVKALLLWQDHIVKETNE